MFTPRVCLYGKLGPISFYDMDLGCGDTLNRAQGVVLLYMVDFDFV